MSTRNVETQGNTTSVSLTIEADACDMTCTWRPSSALTLMQIATGYARDAMGIGLEKLMEMGKLWVVSRLNFSMSRVPKLGEKITLEASAMPAVKLLYPWKFKFLDSDGEIIGEGCSIWNLMDAETRRIAFVPGIGDKIPKPEGAPCRPELPTAAEELSCQPISKAVRPVYTDLDINGHVSNIRYIDWCCNALGAELLRRMAVSSFRISYTNEIRPDDVIDTELRVEDNRFSYSGYKGDSPAFIIDGVLTKR